MSLRFEIQRLRNECNFLIQQVDQMKRQNSNDKFPSKMKEYLLKSDKQIASVEILIQQSQVNFRYRAVRPVRPSRDHPLQTSTGMITVNFSDATFKQHNTMAKILLWWRLKHFSFCLILLSKTMTIWKLKSMGSNCNLVARNCILIHCFILIHFIFYKYSFIYDK